MRRVHALKLLRAIKNEIYAPDKDLFYDGDEPHDSDFIGELYLAVKPLYRGGSKISIGDNPVNVTTQLQGVRVFDLFGQIFSDVNRTPHDILVDLMNSSLRPIPVVVELADEGKVLEELTGLATPAQLDELEVALLCRWHKEVEPAILDYTLLELIGPDALDRIKNVINWSTLSLQRKALTKR